MPAPDAPNADVSENMEWEDVRICNWRGHLDARTVSSKEAGMFMRRRTTLSLLVLTLLAANPAAADDDLVDLELTVPISVADRSTTGTGEELLGYGYDDQTGLVTGAEVRLFARGFGRYARIGVVAGAQHHAGRVLGLDGSYALRTTVIDAGVAVRTIFPCVSDEETRWHLSAVLGVMGVHADAGEGVDGEVNGDRYAERVEASERLDHAGLGWRFGVDLSIHLRNLIVGFGFGARQYFGIVAPVSRGWIVDIGLRVGGRIDFGDHPAQ